MDSTTLSILCTQLGCAASIGLCAIGAAYGTAKTAKGIASLASSPVDAATEVITPEHCLSNLTECQTVVQCSFWHVLLSHL